VSSELHGAKDGDLNKRLSGGQQRRYTATASLDLLDLSVSRVGSVPQKHIESS